MKEYTSYPRFATAHVHKGVFKINAMTRVILPGDYTIYSQYSYAALIRSLSSPSMNELPDSLRHRINELIEVLHYDLVFLNINKSLF